MADITYIEANNKDDTRVPKDTDVIGVTDPDNADKNQGITLLQLQTYLRS